MKKVSSVLIALLSFGCVVFSQTVTIGTQVWMTKNLNVDKFRNGDPIPQAKTNAEWEAAGNNKQPAWCFYNNDPSNSTKYGKLYNWYAVNDKRGLAPAGYHIPSFEEWSKLTNAFGGEAEAGNSMKSKSGWKGNGNGTNNSGFSGIPGGRRVKLGAFFEIGEFGVWWSSEDDGPYVAWTCALGYDRGEVNLVSENKDGNGYSVRCLRD
jgi:uncharacterized protein (TIGR02145 family)